MLAGKAHQRRHVVLVARHGDAKWLHFKNGCIRRIERARQIVEEKLAFQDALQIIADAIAPGWVHGKLPKYKGQQPD